MSAIKARKDVSATIKKTKSRKSNISYSASSAEWIQIIERIGRGCGHEKMLWTETTTSTGKAVAGSYYRLKETLENRTSPGENDSLIAVQDWD